MTKFCDLCMRFQFKTYIRYVHSVSKRRFLIGREKPGVESEVARLISETLEQEKTTPKQDHDPTVQEAENGEKDLQPQESEAEEQPAHIPQEHDHIKQEDQQLAGEAIKSILEEVRERW